VTCRDELVCITDAVTMWTALIDDATADEQHLGFTDEDVDAVEGELRETLPGMLAQLSPEARYVLHHHAGHLREVVAHLWRMWAIDAQQ
jgi:hypothetical protein